MMRVLIIKTSSLGDVIHTLPALTDTKKNHPMIQFDWVVEKSFSEIPRWHNAVNKIIPVELRRWRKNIVSTFKNGEWQKFIHELRQENYDFVIDAQGLVKSGLLTFLSRGYKCGYDWHSAWEPLACLTYNARFRVAPEQHAIDRIRQLFSQALHYGLPEMIPDYGIDKTNLTAPRHDNYLMFLHGTTRDDKCWPEHSWQALIQQVKDKNYRVLLPWGNEVEYTRAKKLAENNPHVEVLPKSSLTELASLLAHAKAVVAVDTGLGHLSAALNTPTISLYGATDPKLIGAIGQNQIHCRANSMRELSVNDVWEKLFTIHSW